MKRNDITVANIDEYIMSEKRHALLLKKKRHFFKWNQGHWDMLVYFIEWQGFGKIKNADSYLGVKHFKTNR